MASGHRYRRSPAFLFAVCAIVLVAAVVASPGLAAGRSSARLAPAGPFDPPGTFDQLEAALSQQNQALAGRLEQVGARLRTDFYGPGTHSWPYWEGELHRSLPMLLGALHGGDHAAAMAAA